MFALLLLRFVQCLTKANHSNVIIARRLHQMKILLISRGLCQVPSAESRVEPRRRLLKCNQQILTIPKLFLLSKVSTWRSLRQQTAAGNCEKLRRFNPFSLLVALLRHLKKLNANNRGRSKNHLNCLLFLHFLKFRFCSTIVASRD